MKHPRDTLNVCVRAGSASAGTALSRKREDASMARQRAAPTLVAEGVVVSSPGKTTRDIFLLFGNITRSKKLLWLLLSTVELNRPTDAPKKKEGHGALFGQ